MVPAGRVSERGRRERKEHVARNAGRWQMSAGAAENADRQRRERQVRVSGTSSGEE